MPQSATHKHKNDRGFSLLELLIVVAILVTLAAITVPRAMSTISDIKMRYVAQNLSGLLQSARMQAVRKNTFYMVQPTTLASGDAAYYAHVRGLVVRLRRSCPTHWRRDHRPHWDRQRSPQRRDHYLRRGLHLQSWGGRPELQCARTALYWGCGRDLLPAKPRSGICYVCEQTFVYGQYQLGGSRDHGQRAHTGLDLRRRRQLDTTGLRDNKMSESPNIQSKIGRHEAGRGESGMGLLELMIAMAVLTIGMLGSMIMILTGMQSNSRNKTDTTATVLDQEILETFATLKNYPQAGQVQIYDCSGNSVYYQASYGQGAYPTGAGAPLTATGDIDWTQPTPTLATSTTAGYAMQYKNCSGDIYEVRWNVMDADPSLKSRLSLLTVSSRQKSASSSHQAMLFAPPTTLRTLLENGAY